MKKDRHEKKGTILFYYVSVKLLGPCIVSMIRNSAQSHRYSFYHNTSALYTLHLCSYFQTVFSCFLTLKRTGFKERWLVVVGVLTNTLLHLLLKLLLLCFSFWKGQYKTNPPQNSLNVKYHSYYSPVYLKM